MKRACVFAVCLLCISSPAAFGDKIYSLIVDGRLREAAELLSEVSTASSRDGNKLFYLSLLEGNADKSARLMEAALKASVGAVYRQEIYYRLAQYYLLKRDLGRLGELVSQYRAMWEAGKYRKEMLRMSVLVDEGQEAYDAAIRQIDRYLLEYSRGEPAQWGMVDKARVMRSFNKGVGSYGQLKKLSREKSGPGVPLALYMLAVDAIDGDRIDEAIFYFNLLREGYPSAVGLDALFEEMESISSSYDRDNAAEKLTGTFYSVQVGVFSVKDNARKQADRFRRYEKRVDIKTKTISGVKYRVVYVGRFADYESAHKFKKMLETDHNELFQVVAR